MHRDADCVFCKVVSVELPVSVVYEDRDVIAFMDINPLSDGHLLVVPREHCDDFRELAPEVAGKLFSCVPKLGRALMEVTGASGFNVLLNNGRAAGQIVPHVHLHLIPRAPADDLGYRWNTKTYPEGRAAELAAALQDAVAKQ